VCGCVVLIDLTLIRKGIRQSFDSRLQRGNLLPISDDLISLIVHSMLAEERDE
jgi:hypothetical protein